MARKRTTGGNAKRKMKRKAYEKELRELQVELCALQDWVKDKGARIIIVFEGRDAAGKGGTIKAITERVSPRVFRTVALPAPSDREKTQTVHAALYRALPGGRRSRDLRPQLVQSRGRRIRHGILHARSSIERFLELCPEVEKYIVDGGITLIKIWLEVGKEEQERRFAARIDDPLRQWKLSPMDLESYGRWYDYSRARDMMLKANRQQARALVHRALGRQAAGATQLHLAHPELDSLRQGVAAEGQIAEAIGQAPIRRSGFPEGKEICDGDLLTLTRRREACAQAENRIQLIDLRPKRLRDWFSLCPMFLVER